MRSKFSTMLSSLMYASYCGRSASRCATNCWRVSSNIESMLNSSGDSTVAVTPAFSLSSSLPSCSFSGASGSLVLVAKSSSWDVLLMALPQKVAHLAGYLSSLRSEVVHVLDNEAQQFVILHHEQTAFIAHGVDE